MSNRPTPYHLLFVKVEYDPNYLGGDYHGVGDMVLIPVALTDAVGVGDAFSRVTGLPRVRIVHWSPDELYDSEGKLVEEWERKKFG